MLDIDAELEDILVNNRIIQKTSLKAAIDYAKKFKEELVIEDTVGLYGVGVDADTLLNFITGVVEDFQIDYCFDQKAKNYKYKNIIKNPIVYTKDDIYEMNVDYMIIGSYLYQEELRTALNEMGYKGVIVNFFEPMEDYLQEHTSDYRTIYETRILYERSQGQERRDALKKLIREYLLIRDFSSAFRYIDVYLSEQDEDAAIYQKLKEDLQELFVKIKSEINARKCNDIIVQWVDAVSYSHLQDFPFLKSKAAHGINFEHAYTVNPWTTETMKVLLYGEYPIEGKLFLRDTFTSENTKLLKLLASNGYRFAYLGMNKYGKLYDGQTIICPELNFRKDDSSIPRQWNALSLLCKVEQALCLLVHTFHETHEPYICGEIEPYQKFACTEEDWSKDECRKQAEVSGRYMDGQYAFYDEIIAGAGISKVYMSDHGRITNSIMRESRIHTFFVIDYPGVKHETVKGIFSLINFYDVIDYLLNGKTDFRQLASEYAIVEALDYYDISIIKMTMNNPRYSQLEGLQRRGIITLEDRYCRFAGGRECFFIKEDDKNDLIGDQKYETRIEELRKLCGDEFIDIYQYDKFKYSRMLYEK